MSKEKKKIKINKLFNTYSIDTIVNILNDVNSKIAFLINISSDDFLFLHSNFKKIHEIINQLTSHAVSLINLHNDKNNVLFVNKTSGMIGNFKKEVLELGKDIYESIENQNEIEKNLDYLFISVNNFNQNLTTLKLLSANLKLDPDALVDASEIDILIDKINKAYPDLLKKIKNLIGDINKSKNTFQSLDTGYFLSINKLTDSIIKFLNTLQTKYKKSVQLKPVLEEKIKRSKENASVIVTNLQYQDIVKQKIEHIEQTHNYILERLTNVSSDQDDPENILTKAKLFLQIKDIAGLQAAQLVYVNKEYQNALETITSNYIELIDIVHEISEMCRNAYSEGFSMEINEFNPSRLFGIMTSISKEFESIDTIYNLNLSNISEKINSFSEVIIDLKDTCKLLVNIVKKDTRDLLLKNKEENNSSGVLDQVNEVTDELLKTVGQIEKYNEKNVSGIVRINKVTKKLNKIKDLETEMLGELSEKNKVIRILSQNYKKEFTEYTPAIDQCLIPEDLVKSVQKVKYYEAFEKEIEKIIFNLHDISIKLHVEESILKDEDRETLDMLKKRYTVESEHIIHDHVSGKKQKGDIDLFDDSIGIPDKNKEDNDENLELF